MKLTNDRAEQIKKDFPIFGNLTKPLIYLDNAATTQKPQSVINRLTRFYTFENANIHRGVYKLSEDATVHYEQSHEQTSTFFNTSPQEIIFTKGTTESINLLSHTIAPLLEGNEIVLTEMEHHSNLVPWQQFARRHNLKLKFISMKDDFTLDYQDAANKITENTALVAFQQVSNALGTIHEAKKIIALAKNHNALTLIDGAQGAPHHHTDLRSLDCDFYACSAHKMLGPTGLGILYGNKKHLERMSPYQFGGDMIRTVSFTNATWNDLPMKFEAGTPPIAAGIAFSEALSYLEHIGVEHIAAWEKELLHHALDRISEIKDAKFYSAGADQSAGIISFTMGKAHAHDVGSLLGDSGVCVRGGHHCAMPLMEKLGIAGTVRASFYLYNTTQEIDIMVEALKEVDHLFH